MLSSEDWRRNERQKVPYTLVVTAREPGERDVARVYHFMASVIKLGLKEIELRPGEDADKCLAAITSAAKKYLKTDEGRKQVEDNCGSFNWGDAMCFIPNHLFEEAGMEYLTGTHLEGDVEHDADLTWLADEEDGGE